MVWDKVEGFGEVDVVHRPLPKPDGFGSNRPGPPIEPIKVRSQPKSVCRFAKSKSTGRVSVWRPSMTSGCSADAPSTFASFLVDRLAKRETE
jgi:hypothetical protein